MSRRTLGWTRWFVATTLAVIGLWVASPRIATAAPTATVSCSEPRAVEPAAGSALESYEPINPVRIVDTRDGTGGHRGAVGAGCVLRLRFDSSIVPADAAAVGLSVTTVTDVRGFASVFPCRVGRPDTSNVNTRPGVATPNFVVGMLDTRRQLCVFVRSGAHLVIDLAGWWAPGTNRFSAVEPRRVEDTREQPGGARLPAGHVRNVQVGGEAGVPLDAHAAVINFTVVAAAERGWALVYPCGSPTPRASTSNFLAGEAKAVSAIVGLGGSPPGQLCVTSNVDIHFIIDVAGYYAPAPSFGPTAALHPEPGRRLVDSRDGTGGWTTPLRHDETRRLDPVALSALADRATAVMLNVAVVNSGGRGHLRISSCGGSVPTSSAVNFLDGTAASNLVTVDLSDDRGVCVRARGASTDVIIDLFAVMAVPDGSLAERMSPEGLDTWPDFDAAGTDYGLVCASGRNRFDLEVVPLPRAGAWIDGVRVPAGRHRIALTADELTTVELRRGAERRRYHFRCLPDDFPVLDVDRPGAPAAGWYLTQFGQGASPSGEYLVILDEFGAPVWYKAAERDLLAVVRRSDGTIGANNSEQYYGTTDDDVSRRTYALDGSLLDVRRPPDPASYPADHHDFIDLPNGGGVFLSYPVRTGVDLTALNTPGEPPEFGDDENVLDGAIVEVDRNGVETWRWNSKDHFAVEESTFPLRWSRTFPLPAGEVDLIHPNSLDVAGDGSGDYIVSARHLDAAFRVNRNPGGPDDGAVEWVLGGSSPTVTNTPRLRIVGDPYGGPLRPHDARLNGDVLTLFDNRTQNGRGQPARAVAYRIDPVAMTATMLWQIRHLDGAFSQAQGSARVTPDGSVLLSWGATLPVFEEFSASGERLMSITQLPTGFSYRIIKYAPSAFDRATLRANAGGDLGVE
jgi:hypothetical protein